MGLWGEALIWQHFMGRNIKGSLAKSLEALKCSKTVVTISPSLKKVWGISWERTPVRTGGYHSEKEHWPNGLRLDWKWTHQQMAKGKDVQTQGADKVAHPINNNVYRHVCIPWRPYMLQEHLETWSCAGRRGETILTWNWWRTLRIDMVKFSTL